MAISILLEPDYVNLSQSPIVYQLQTDNYVQTAGVAAQAIITIPGGGSTPFAEDDTITFDIDDFIVTLTCKNAPDNSGTQFRPYTGGLVSLYTEILAEDFNKNYYLSSIFQISSSGNTVVLNARVIENKTISISAETYYNPSYSYVTGVSTVYRPNFKIYVELWIMDTNNEFKKELDLEYDINDDGIAIFDLKEILHSFLSAKSLFNSEELFNDTDAIYSIKNDIRPFYIRYAEKYGETQVIYGLANSLERIVVLGGESSINKLNNDYSANYVGAGKFLSRLPDTRYTCVEKTEFLSFFINDTEDTYIVEANLYDNTNALITTLNVNSGFLGESGSWILLINVSYLFNLSSLLEDYPDLSRFKIRLKSYSTGDYVSNEITYIIQEKKLYNTFFIYQNSVGGADSIWCTGEREEGLKIDKTEFEANNTGSSLFYFNPINSSQTRRLGNSFRANTGPFRKSEFNAVIDFLSSNHVWITYFEEGSPYRYKKVTIERGTFQLFKESDDIASINFSFTIAETQPVYTNLFIK